MIEPAKAITVIAESIGREARRAVVELAVAAWVDAIPERELDVHYAKALAGLEAGDLHALAGAYATSDRAVALASPARLFGVFQGLGEQRRRELRRAACRRGVAAFDAGVTEQQVLTAVLPCLSPSRLEELARDCTALYLGDRLGGVN
jgi:hypothetical protein